MARSRRPRASWLVFSLIAASLTGLAVNSSPVVAGNYCSDIVYISDVLGPNQVNHVISTRTDITAIGYVRKGSSVPTHGYREMSRRTSYNTVWRILTSSSQSGVVVYEGWVHFQFAYSGTCP